MLGDGGEVMQDEKLTLRRRRADAYADGHCGKTTDGQSGDCATGNFGSLKLNHFVLRTWQTVMAECTQRCQACSRCKFVRFMCLSRLCPGCRLPRSPVPVSLNHNADTPYRAKYPPHAKTFMLARSLKGALPLALAISFNAGLT